MKVAHWQGVVRTAKMTALVLLVLLAGVSGFLPTQVEAKETPAPKSSGSGKAKAFGATVGQGVQIEAWSMPPCELKEDVYLRNLTFTDTNLKLPYLINFNCPSKAVNRAVIVIYGNSRNVSYYFNAIRMMVPLLPSSPPPASTGQTSSADKKKSTVGQIASTTSSVPFTNATQTILPTISSGQGTEISVSGVNVTNVLGHVEAGSTVIVAPKFPVCTSSECDAEIDPANPGYYYWSSNNTWKIGQLTASALVNSGYGPQRSSFEMLDALISRLWEKYPNLRYYTIVGHSAGGQFVQRYAATTQSLLSMQYFGGDVHFVVANPSSYVYLNPERLVDGVWQIPSTCSSYNNYKYGLSETSLQLSTNSYIAATGVDLIRAYYPSRKVAYLLGENDTDAGEFDESCAANFQGPSRRGRGEIYFQYMNQFYPGHIHEIGIVPGVGHNGQNMFNSALGRAKILWW